MGGQDYYAVLNLSRNASAAEIVQAYRAAISAYETDSLAAYSLFDETDLEKLRREAEEAYQILSQADRRQAYDATLPPANIL